MVSFCLPKGLHGITSCEDFHLLVDSLFILCHDLFNSMASQRLQKTSTRTAENKQTSKPNQTKPSQAQPKPTKKQTNKQTNKQRSKEQKGTNKRKKQRKTETTKQTNNAMNLSKPLLVTLHWKRWQPHRLQPRSRPSSAPSLRRSSAM